MPEACYLIFYPQHIRGFAKWLFPALNHPTQESLYLHLVYEEPRMSLETKMHLIRVTIIYLIFFIINKCIHVKFREMGLEEKGLYFQSVSILVTTNTKC